MKKFIYMAVAAIAALSSCRNEDVILESNTQNEVDKVFTATMEQSAGTRTTLAGNTPNWESGDKIIMIGSSTNGIYTAEPDESDKTKATLTKLSGDAPTNYCIAYYPADYVTVNSNQQIIATLPAVHTYSEGKFNMPMVAYAEGTFTNLSFNNLCGVLAVTVKGISDIKAVRVISASATDKLSGHFALSNQTQDGKFQAVMMATGNTSNQVSVNCGSGVDADAATGKVFYFPLPPATYDSLQVVVESGINTVAHMTSEDEVTIERNKIYRTTFNPNLYSGRYTVLPIYATTSQATGNPASLVKCVTLWSGSPIFATINVGQTVTNYASINTPVTDENKATVYSTANVGGLYQWGGTINRRDNTGDNDYSSSTTDMAGTADDTAMKLWGPIWRMPTKAELNHLRNYKDDSTAALATAVTTWTKCDGQTGDGHAQYVTGCTLFGYKVAGKGDFSGNSVFLPLAGSKDYIYGNVSSQGQCAFYRSTTPSSASGYALSLNFSSTSYAPSVCVDEISSFSSVRAVLK